MMSLTLFVLFAGDIAQLATPSAESDYAIIIVYSIALFFYIFDFFFGTW
jgi:hypothetical protein